MSKSFEELGINANLVQGLKKEGILQPKAVQNETIPYVLANRDVIGQSQTGSGKTLAFLLPVFQKIDSTKREMQVLILAPTHELVMQIDKVAKTLATNAEVSATSTAIIGEANIARQIDKLKEKPHIIVGSPGRVLELIKKKKINTQTIKTIIIDEADKLLDDFNIGVIKDVIKTTMKDRQLMAFSANVTEKALVRAKELMQQPEIIKIDEKQIVNTSIIHAYLVCEHREKLETLRKVIAALKPSRAIIFINRSEEIKETTSKLQFHHFKVTGVFGDASKEERKKALEGFRRGEYELLVASDLAARGLDIKEVTHIFNLDLPEDPKEYLHRVGRTGRADAGGSAISIVTQREVLQLARFAKEFKIEIAEKEVFKGAIRDPFKSKAVVKKPIIKK